MVQTHIHAQWVEHFDDICQMDQWLDIQVTEGWDIQSLEAHDISQSYPGQLMLMPFTVSWFANWRGPLLYRMTAGDFVLTTHVTATNRAGNDIPGSAYSLGGIMVRNPKTMTNGLDDWLPDEEDYVFLSLGRAADDHPSCPGCPAPHFEVKSTINSASTLLVSSIDTNVADIRMVRLSPYILVLYRFPNEEWEVHHRYLRADLMDTVQVGMVTYTDWDKVFTYTPEFHNSHVLHADMEYDPSSNPGIPFTPDIITTYDFLELQGAEMPDAWVGVDLLNETLVTDEEILLHFGDSVPLPAAPSAMIWLGGQNQNWEDVDNWLAGNLPGVSDTVRVNTCACPEANCVTLPVDLVEVSGLEVAAGAVLTVPAGAVLQINGDLINVGVIIIEGELIVSGDSTNPVMNRGEIECRSGGAFHVLD